MSLLDIKKIEALVYLLDDIDLEIGNQIANELVNIGQSAIPFLEDAILVADNEFHRSRIDETILLIRDKNIAQKLENWIVTDQQDLLEAWCIVSELSNKEINRVEIKNKINQIRLTIWLGLFNEQSSYEKIQLLNHIFFNQNKFSGDNESYNSPNNSFINEVIERKKGNPISLSVLYMLIAQRLNLPVFGINLPQHFVLAYYPLDVNSLLKNTKDNLESDIEMKLIADFNEEPLFFINPFNKGAIFSKVHLIKFLKEIKVDTDNYNLTVSSNKEIVQRMLRNLQYSYSFLNKSKAKNRVDKLIGLFDV